MKILFGKLLILLVPIALFGALLWVDIAPGGVREIRVVAGDSSPFVDHFLPRDRLTAVVTNDDGEGYETMIKDPVYFSVHPPMTAFDELEIELAFSLENQPVLEIGPLVDTFSRTFDLRPLEQTQLDILDWPKITSGDLTIFARNGDVRNASIFLADPPARSRIATYHATLSDPVILPDYTPTGTMQTTEITLRGDHKYLTYIKNESFYLKAEFWDMNRTTGTDSGAIIVRDASGNAVLSKEFADDGDTREDQEPGPQTVELSGSGLAEGVYSVELKATSDIFWHRLSTTQRYMTFVNEVYLGDEIGYLAATRPVSLVTNAKYFTMETYHGSAVQTVKVGSQDIDIVASHQPFQARIKEQGIVKVTVPKGDLQITGAGKFAFSEAMFFDPEPVRFADDIDLDARGIDYVVAQYTPPTTDGNWKRASVSFDFEDLKSEDGSVFFALSAPGIVDREGGVKLHEIIVRFKKEPMSLWSKEFWKAVRDRLPFGL